MLPKPFLGTDWVGELLSIHHIGKAVLSFWGSGPRMGWSGSVSWKHQGGCGTPWEDKVRRSREVDLVSHHSRWMKTEVGRTGSTKDVEPVELEQFQRWAGVFELGVGSRLGSTTTLIHLRPWEINSFLILSFIISKMGVMLTCQSNQED